MTAPGWASTSSSAARRSRSSWSMTAMSPGCSRLVSRLVRRSTRAGPMTTEPGPGRRSAISAASLAGRRGEELFGVSSRCLAGGLAREHARQLDDAIGAPHGLSRGEGATSALFLGHSHLLVGEGGDLREVGDDQDLVVL